MEPNAPKDPLDPPPSSLPISSDIPPAPLPPSDPFVPPAPPVVDPAPPTGSFAPSSYELPPGATPPPVSSFTGPDVPSPGAGLGTADVSSLTPAVPSTKDERLWATLIHLGGVFGLFGFAGMTFGLPIPVNILLPLVLWLVKREGNPFINDQGKEALNFQITVFLASLICVPLALICIGIPMLIAIAVASLVLGIIAAIKANEGVAYRYPFAWRLIN